MSEFPRSTILPRSTSTPLHLELLMHYAYRAEPFQGEPFQGGVSAPAVVRYTADLQRAGLIEGDATSHSGYRATAGGELLLGAILNVPWPKRELVHRWHLPVPGGDDRYAEDRVEIEKKPKTKPAANPGPGTIIMFNGERLGTCRKLHCDCGANQTDSDALKRVAKIARTGSSTPRQTLNRIAAIAIESVKAVEDQLDRVKWADDIRDGM